MERSAFEQLRDLPNKLIEGDIRFERGPDKLPLLCFGPIPVKNSAGYELRVNGAYNLEVGSLKINFFIPSEGGAICRVEVNGPIHKDAGRTHKHSLWKDSCPRKNLPYAVARPELEALKPAEIWAWICQEARIEHRGRCLLHKGGGYYDI